MAVFGINLKKIWTALAAKADKIVGATAGRLASLDSQGNLVDSGKAATDFAASNDSRLTNARTPTAHASTHASGQSDALSGTHNISVTGYAQELFDQLHGAHHTFASNGELNINVSGAARALTDSHNNAHTFDANDRLSLSITGSAGGLTDTHNNPHVFDANDRLNVSVTGSAAGLTDTNGTTRIIDGNGKLNVSVTGSATALEDGGGSTHSFIQMGPWGWKLNLNIAGGATSLQMGSNSLISVDPYTIHVTGPLAFNTYSSIADTNFRASINPNYRWLYDRTGSNIVIDWYGSSYNSNAYLSFDNGMNGHFSRSLCVHGQLYVGSHEIVGSSGYVNWNAIGGTPLWFNGNNWTMNNSLSVSGSLSGGNVYAWNGLQSNYFVSYYGSSTLAWYSSGTWYCNTLYPSSGSANLGSYDYRWNNLYAYTVNGYYIYGDSIYGSSFYSNGNQVISNGSINANYINWSNLGNGVINWNAISGPPMWYDSNYSSWTMSGNTRSSSLYSSSYYSYYGSSTLAYFNSSDYSWYCGTLLPSGYSNNLGSWDHRWSGIYGYTVQASSFYGSSYYSNGNCVINNGYVNWNCIGGSPMSYNGNSWNMNGTLSGSFSGDGSNLYNVHLQNSGYSAWMDYNGNLGNWNWNINNYGVLSGSNGLSVDASWGKLYRGSNVLLDWSQHNTNAVLSLDWMAAYFHAPTSFYRATSFYGSSVYVGSSTSVMFGPRIIAYNLPTSPTGLVPGQLYRDGSNFVKVVP